VILSSLYEPFQRLRLKQTLSRGVLGMTVAHIGVGLFAIGVTVTQSYRVEKDVALRAGESVELKGYKFDFKDTKQVQAPNYDAIESEVVINARRQARGDAASAEAHYRVQTMR